MHIEDVLYQEACAFQRGTWAMGIQLISAGEVENSWGPLSAWFIIMCWFSTNYEPKISMLAKLRKWGRPIHKDGWLCGSFDRGLWSFADHIPSFHLDPQQGSTGLFGRYNDLVNADYGVTYSLEALPCTNCTYYVYRYIKINKKKEINQTNKHTYFSNIHIYIYIYTYIYIYIHRNNWKYTHTPLLTMDHGELLSIWCPFCQVPATPRATFCATELASATAKGGFNGR